MNLLPGSVQMFLHPLRYWRRWLQIYQQWEFWALCLVVIGTYSLLDHFHQLPQYFVDHPSAGKSLVTALIMTPMPYLMRRKDIRLAGKDDWFMRLLKSFQKPSQLLGQIAGVLLVVSAVAYCLPIFATKPPVRAISGFELSLHHPLAAMIPICYLIAGLLVAYNKREWRVMAMLWIGGCWIGTFAVAGLYTNTDVDVPGAFGWLAILALALPPIAFALCAIPPKKD